MLPSNCLLINSTEKKRFRNIRAVVVAQRVKRRHANLKIGVMGLNAADYLSFSSSFHSDSPS